MSYGLVSPALFAVLMFSTGSFQSPGTDDAETAFEGVIVAPTDWSSLKEIQMEDDDCGSASLPDSCESSLPKLKTTAEERSVIIADECNVETKVLAAYQPCYPTIAKLGRASGQVLVLVVVDESGEVRWARAYRGHPLLRFAALRAACKWRFEPAQCGRVNRMISFNFVLQ